MHPSSNADRAQRQFVAIKIGAHLTDSLSALQRDWDRSLPRGAVRWVRASQIHLTLLFLGQVPDERVPGLCARLASALRDCRQLHLGLRGIGAFPDSRQPRVIWAGVDGDLDELAMLRERVSTAGAADVERPEIREFRPHLTLGRVASRDRRDLGAVARTLADAPPVCLGSWQVGEVVLIRSHLNPSGSVYTDIGRFVLQGSGTVGRDPRDGVPRTRPGHLRC